MTRAVCSKSPPGRLRNGPGTTWAPGGSFANQKHSVLELFGSPSLKLRIMCRKGSETILTKHRLPDARFPNENNWFSTILELHDRGMKFNLRPMPETVLTEHELLNGRGPNKKQ